MRVIAGQLGGRVFQSPPGHRTHPMGDRVRSALFNTLGDITGLSVLDAFSGSGAIGIEAVSRGARRAVAVEIDQLASRTIQENIVALGIADKMQHTHAAVRSWARRVHDVFDVVIADPPYDKLDYKTLELLPDRCVSGGVLVYSLPPHARLRLPQSCQLLSAKTYGDATLSFYRKIA